MALQDPGTPRDVFRSMREVAPLTEEDAEQLHALLTGVYAASERMRLLSPVFPAEVDTSEFSVNVDWDELS